MGGFLAKPKTLVENTFVKGLVQNNEGENTWIGLTQLSDMVMDKKWFWGGHGDPLWRFNDWAPGEPAGNGRCGQLYDEDHYHWDDNDCDDERPFVCQLPVSG